jgi:hypothetical protein
MIGFHKIRVNCLVAALAITVFSGSVAPAQTETTDPSVEKAKEILLKGVGSSNPDTRQLGIMAASLIGDPSMREKLIPLMDDKKDQVAFRAGAGYLRLTVVAQKSQ